MAPLKQHVNLRGTVFIGHNLIEDANDLESSAGKIRGDALEKGLPYVKFDEAELDVNEVNCAELIAAFKNSKLATLDVDFQEDRMTEGGEINAGVEPFNWRLNGARALHTECSLLCLPRLKQR